MIISISDVDSSGTHAPTGRGTYMYFGSSPPSPPYKSLNDLEVNAETDVSGRCGFEAIGTITSGTVTLDSVVADVLTGKLENPPAPSSCM
jgi:hypothetical protein